jgi:hypothetical protein
VLHILSENEKLCRATLCRASPKGTNMTKIIKPNSLSLSSIFLEPQFGNNPLSIATGFVWEHQNAHYLVTNWHVMTGLHAQTKQPLCASGATPDRIRVWLHTADRLVNWEYYGVELFDNQGRPRWKEHQTFGSNVDVAVIRLEVSDKFRIFPVNKIDFGEFRFEISQDVFIVGFPRGITGAGKFPIWKRGSIASEPDVDIDNVPKLLIDSATREGMSGSPVIAQYVGVYKEKPENPDPFDWIGEERKFLGVYSGRLPGQDIFEAQLGIVWKASLIDEIIVSGVQPD